MFYLVAGAYITETPLYDSVIVWLIEHWVSNWAPVVATIQFFSIVGTLIFDDDKPAGLLWTASAWTVVQLYYQLRVMRLSGRAIRRIVPEWDFVPIGESLYPSLYYLVK